ncbi:hypothetical protein NITUZ_40495 [Candidatus Nitrosotenuis uzonensis]|uniref:Uncharacterized protein n=1 Tax=Candidatus Nitrosotenuis uzonensis TaxID=1407055 RepID=V6AUW8_9ARCH|nr:hypothetical protein NITUZ_40495 [Candidatus Nitrosotenuis uzonensis]
MKQNRANESTPKKWKCCNELVAPKNLAQHFKEKHLNDGRRFTKDEFIILISNVIFLIVTIVIF